MMTYKFLLIDKFGKKYIVKIEDLLVGRVFDDIVLVKQFIATDRDGNDVYETNRVKRIKYWYEDVETGIHEYRPFDDKFGHLATFADYDAIWDGEVILMEAASHEDD